MSMSPAKQAIAQAVGARIRALRLGLSDRPTQEQFAHRAGITFGTLNRIEQGHQMAEIRTLEKITDQLGVDLQDLLREALIFGSDAGIGYFAQMPSDLDRELATAV